MAVSFMYEITRLKNTRKKDYCKGEKAEDVFAFSKYDRVIFRTSKSRANKARWKKKREGF